MSEGGGRVVLSPGAARVLAIVVLLTIGLAGMAGGVALDRYVILPRRFGVRPPAEPRGVFFGARGGRQAFQERLTQYLDLSAQQRTQFDSLMNREERELRAARATAQPRIDSIVSETRREVDAILSPAQREKLHKLREDGLAPGGRDFGGRDSADPGRRGRRGGGGGGPPFP